jgi:hypothetical protein
MASASSPIKVAWGRLRSSLLVLAGCGGAGTTSAGTTAAIPNRAVAPRTPITLAHAYLP